MDIDDIRLEFEDYRGDELAELVWTEMVRRYGDELADLDMPELDARYALLVEIAEGVGGSGKDRIRDVPDYAAVALANIFAFDAGELLQVQKFRRQVLRGALVPPDEVATWARKRAKRETPTRWIRVPDDDKDNPDVRSYSRDLLLFPDGDNWESAVAVKHGSLLDRLRVISEQLARQFGWQTGQATAFVLTNVTPEPFMGSSSWSLRAPYPARSRIILELNPRMSPERVMKYYRKVRAEILGKRTRHRAIKERSAQLAVFAAKVRNSNRTWQEAQEVWNDEYPDWAYSRTPGFIDAARTSYERVTGQRLEWGGKA